jgi:hypothetical protein
MFVNQNPSTEACHKMEEVGGVEEASGCVICMETEGALQSGCACRGDQGLAHVACRIEAAVHFSADQGPFLNKSDPILLGK